MATSTTETPALTLAERVGGLVRIPSVNPLQAGPKSGSDGERDISAWLADQADQLGAQVTVDDILDGRNNVYARFAGQTDRVGHDRRAPRHGRRRAHDRPRVRRPDRGRPGLRPGFGRHQGHASDRAERLGRNARRGRAPDADGKPRGHDQRRNGWSDRGRSDTAIGCYPTATVLTS